MLWWQLLWFNAKVEITNGNDQYIYRNTSAYSSILWNKSYKPMYFCMCASFRVGFRHTPWNELLAVELIYNPEYACRSHTHTTEKVFYLVSIVHQRNCVVWGFGILMCVYVCFRCVSLLYQWCVVSPLNRIYRSSDEICVLTSVEEKIRTKLKYLFRENFCEIAICIYRSCIKVHISSK